MPRPTVTAVVPAHNEESTIGGVVRTLVQSPLIDQVIVVSDGSKDRTEEEARMAGATVYATTENRGKGGAMLHGVAHANTAILFFCDADLLNLSEDHIERVLLPVLSGARAMNVGLHDRGPLNPFLPYLPLIGGERAMLRQVFEGVPPEYVQGFMVESALNYYCRSRKLAYGAVLLPKLAFRRKYDKVGWKKAMFQYVRMFGQVLQAMLIVRLARLFKRF